MLTIEKDGRGYRLESEQFLPARRGDLFPFFGDAGNLERITPDQLHFKIITPLPIEMKAGAIIDYRLKIRGIPVGWRTEITAWEPDVRFIDEARKSPYKWWHHEHTFEDVDRDGVPGTLCRDVVSYGVPGGGLAHTLLVKRDLLGIFTYRRGVLEEIFGSAASASASVPAESPMMV